MHWDYNRKPALNWLHFSFFIVFNFRPCINLLGRNASSCSLLSSMCTAACVDFIRRHLTAEDVEDREVLEVGALNVNGSVRPVVSALHPRSYIGIDLQPGPDVDEVCDAAQLVQRFGSSRFDLLISTEVLEHVRDWQKVVAQFKEVLRPGGILLITTRSPGFPYHGFPDDFWRYEPSDLQIIFSDFEREVIESDPLDPGVFLKARKPKNFVMRRPDAHALFSIVTCRRVLAVSDARLAMFHARGRWQRVIRAPERFARRLRNKILS